MSNAIKISATLREDFGKGYARRIRMAGDIPAVVYGHGTEPQHLVLPGHATTLAARHANAILSIDVEGGQQILAMIKDIQRHPIRPELQHIDLLIVKRGERVEIEVPLHIEGEVEKGAVANQEETVILVEADALQSPEAIVASIEGRKVGQHLLAGDIDLPAGVSLAADPELLIVNVSEPEALDVPEAGEEAAEQANQPAEAE
ncbi:MAG: 50S ribosomal protein L25/general stress protein Ctc [Rothia sp. (in: high G+C Gram-positive bacteria)]|nr:50S ribosomal protein L25/general stress protein Ctc [Rothia sp. (in: high G+C Gram-positive bacteria)]